MIPLRDSLPSRNKPLITGCLIAINALVFLFELSLAPGGREAFVHTFGMVPDRFAWSSLLTSMFLHGGWLHLIGNMWFLWIYGDNVEDILGHGRFLLFYLVCGMAAGLSHLVFNFDSAAPTVGASGAIAGVMGGYLRRFPHARIVTLLPLFIFFTTIELPAYVILLYWFAIQIFSGVGDSARAGVQEGGVAWWAHAGGFVTGVLLVGLLEQRNRRLPPDYPGYNAT
ncbi:MAG: rhomboid family intramembrane serine protease [Bryobacterales bacterium]|nr:rhomboid family intramembrane serine protease [Bryobacterales bacterium]